MSTGYPTDMATTRGARPARPGPAWWLWYAFGGRLPDRYRAWVRHDATTRTWLPRHLIRIVVAASPLLAALFVGLRLLTGISVGWIVGALGVGLLFTLFYATGMARELVRVRLARHGFPPEVTPPPSRVILDDDWH
jgi:hypothetical protein